MEFSRTLQIKKKKASKEGRGPLGGSSGVSLGSPGRLLGAPETSKASKSDAKSLSDANLSSQLAFGALKINDFH